MRFALASALLLVVACGREAARTPRRWDTSQTVIKFPSAGVVAVATPRRWTQGIQSDYMREFLDEFDAAADSLERSGFLVAETFRDTIRIVYWPDSVTVVRPVNGQTDGYYLVTPGREPRFVPGSLKARELMKVLRGWLAEPPPQAANVPRTAIDSATQVAVAAAGASPPPTVLLPLDSFPNLPPNARVALERRGCRVPQSQDAEPGPNNVVPGQFTRRGQTDWAALCATGDRMIVVVVWGGPSPCPDTIAQTAGAVSPDFYLGTADSTYIENHEQMYGEGRAFPITHEGLNVGTEKASTVWYCHAGKWWELPGAD